MCSATRAPGRTLHLDVRVSRTELCERQSYDMAAVRVRILDEYGAVASYAQLPVELHAEGDIALAGTDTVTAEGGMCGTYVRSLGRGARHTAHQGRGNG